MYKSHLSSDLKRLYYFRHDLTTNCGKPKHEELSKRGSSKYPTEQYSPYCFKTISGFLHHKKPMAQGNPFWFFVVNGPTGHRGPRVRFFQCAPIPCTRVPQYLVYVNAYVQCKCTLMSRTLMSCSRVR